MDSLVMTTRRQDIARAALELYKLYPRHVGRGAALKAIARAMSKESYDFLFDAVTEYGAARQGQDSQFTPHPATWFNQERYHDDRTEWYPQKPVKAQNSQANEDYDVMCCEVRRVGAQQIPSYPNQSSREAIAAMGGWRAFCDWSTNEIQWRRKRFVENYR